MPRRNILEALLENSQRLKDKPCFQFKKEGRWETLSWVEAERLIFQIASGLQSLGVKKGDAVALFCATRMEWTVADLAILSIGAVTVPIYQSNTAEQASYILQNSGARVLFADHRENLPGRKKIILMSGAVPKDSDLLSWGDLKKMGEGKDQEAWKRGIETIQPKDAATIVYTSGTTGPPKGAVLSHGNFTAEMESCRRLFDITDRDRSLIFLPLAHILARVMQMFQIEIGFTQAYAESVDKLVDNIGEVRPHFFASVPRIFEKVYERVLQQVEQGSPVKKAIFSWASAVGRELSAKKQAGDSAGLFLTLQGGLASALVFQKLRNRLGGRLRYTVCGGAPLSREIAEFFHAAGILILEGYGLTETTAAINCNTVDHFKFGTVGRPAFGVEEKIASDGEICVRGPLVFQGYYKDPQATQAVLTDDGWFKTGDIGEIDAEGFLKITDRKKDIIVTAAGKNIAPQNIENLLKTVPFISQVMVHGDRRKYLSALVTLNREPVEEFARKEGIAYRDFGELTHHPRVFKLVERAIEDKNRTMASFETVKKFAILENDFTQETGELTPTLKVKRKFVSEKYKDVLEQLYRDS